MCVISLGVGKFLCATFDFAVSPLNHTQKLMFHLVEFCQGNWFRGILVHPDRFALVFFDPLSSVWAPALDFIQVIFLLQSSDCLLGYFKNLFIYFGEGEHSSGPILHLSRMLKFPI